MRRKLRLIVFTLVLCIITACSGSGESISDFTFVNQNNEKVGLKELKGKIWVADFVFTSCETVCPPMTAHMTELQKRAEQAGTDVHFVSFSVDPEVDTPEKLTEFAENYPLNLKKWDFLTGYTQEEIEAFAKKNFQVLVKKPEGEEQVIHGTSFYLMNQNGELVSDYNGFKDVPYEEIIEDIKKLQ
ncbi:SCO family protein [Metabacillus arenae]|uniref:SCO family protein n=1 Tax=Metabacillus arenae TaxID=2771434 RepID=A0A926NKE8_9BACI|nr:SCO family protein [Metabacillus arenae]MBD1381593.1 SCO family protein [Metabacillus arenae]